MATPLPADKMLSALKAEGVKVVEYKSWRTHNRPSSTGAWGPVHGVMIHHTASSGTASSVDLCYDGYAGLPGPLCHGVIAKDGTVYMVGNGRANHAGRGDRSVLDRVIAERPPYKPGKADVDGNPHFYGFEAVNLGNGVDPWPEAQLDAIERVSAAICRAHGWAAGSTLGHLEWQPGKPDPRGFTMASMRTRVEQRLKSPPAPPKPTPKPPTGGVHTVVRGDTLWGIARQHGTTVAELRKLNPKIKSDLIRPGDKVTVPGRRTYTVRSGDTLSSIAARYPGVSWQQIASTNGIQPPYVIRPGDVLVIPS
ncbi:LysM peptidoglycan-binding domain-containing protein [Streptomyces xiamenensis]|uniref:LysM peptidoglycan-binding domain-containing protein n=1 Tax=Streptomyces xiamenensis TaxID=408015 RepID=UPI0035DC4EC9